MHQKTEGIVLHALKYGDSSLIVKIFTRHFGLKSFMIRGYRSKKSTMPASLFLPLTLIRLDLKSSKTSSSFSAMNDAHCYEPLPELRSDFMKQAMGVFIAEVLYKSIADEEAHEELYNYIEHTLKYLNDQEAVSPLFAHFFLINYSRYLGLYPNVHSEEETVFFDLQNGVFSDTKSKHADFLMEEESYALKILLNAEIEELPALKFSNVVRNNLLAGLIQYYRIHLLNLREIKSHLILAEVLRS